MSDTQTDTQNDTQNDTSKDVNNASADAALETDVNKTATDPDDNLPTGIKKRFAKLTREKYEFKNQYDSLRSEFDALKTSLEKPKQYATKEEAVADLVSKEIAKRDEAAKIAKEHEEKVSKYVQKYNESDISDIDDYDDVVQTVPINLSDPVDKDIADYLINSDSGKRLTYELCKSPELLSTLRQMSYSVRAKTLIKLDDQLYAGISAKKAEKIVDDTIDDAGDQTQKKVPPKLIKPVTGKTVPKGNGALSMREYMDQRNQRLSKKR